MLKQTKTKQQQQQSKRKKQIRARRMITESDKEKRKRISTVSTEQWRAEHQHLTFPENLITANPPSNSIVASPKSIRPLVLIKNYTNVTYGTCAAIVQPIIYTIIDRYVFRQTIQTITCTEDHKIRTARYKTLKTDRKMIKQ